MARPTKTKASPAASEKRGARSRTDKRPLRPEEAERGLNAEERSVFEQLSGLMLQHKRRDLEYLYQAAGVAHAERAQALHGETCRGTKRRRIVNPESTSLGRLNFALHLPKNFLFDLAKLRDAWPNKRKFINEVVQPARSAQFDFSGSHVFLLAKTLGDPEYAALRRDLVKQCCQNRWKRDELWNHIRDARREFLAIRDGP